MRSIERLGGEAAEDDGVRRADAGAGQHGDGQLGHHAHVDGDAVALFHAERSSAHWRISALRDAVAGR